MHLAENMRQYGIHVLTQSKYNRNRHIEFSSSSKSMNKKELHQVISHSIMEPCKIIEQLSIEQFEKYYSIQGFKLTGVSVAVHISEHLSYHVGQVGVITKMISDKDLEFYAGLNLNITD